MQKNFTVYDLTGEKDVYDKMINEGVDITEADLARRRTCDSTSGT